MEPKDMTNNDLVKHHADARAFAENSDYDLAKRGALKVSEDCGIELLRRLNEADALRKENAELRNAHAKLLKDYAELKVNAAIMVACDDALESLDSSEDSQPEAKCASLSEEIDRIKAEDGRAK